MFQLAQRTEGVAFVAAPRRADWRRGKRLAGFCPSKKASERRFVRAFDSAKYLLTVFRDKARGNVRETSWHPVNPQQFRWEHVRAGTPRLTQYQHADHAP